MDERPDQQEPAPWVAPGAPQEEVLDAPPAGPADLVGSAGPAGPTGPPGQGGPAWPAAPPFGGWPAHAPGAAPLARQREGFAVAALVTGLAGMVPFSFLFGILAIRRIRRTGTRGLGLVITGFAASLAWILIVVSAGGFAAGRISDDLKGKGDGAGELFPAPGECFDLPPSGSSTRAQVHDCDRPHDAQMILLFELPRGPWPGDAEVERLGLAGCQERLGVWEKRREVASDLGIYALRPGKVGWWAGIRTVRCALHAQTGRRMTASLDLSNPAPDVRGLAELAEGDCLTPLSPRDPRLARLVGCDRPHKAQVTTSVPLPAEDWAGEGLAGGRIEALCNRQWMRLFRKRSPGTGVEFRIYSPSSSQWERGERTAVCYVQASKGRLTKNLVKRG